VVVPPIYKADHHQHTSRTDHQQFCPGPDQQTSKSNIVKREKTMPTPLPGTVRPRQRLRLPPDAIERCVRTVELALRRRRCREEAIAAIDRLFGMEQPPPPTLDSSVHDIGLRLRTASILDEAEIRTAFELRLALKTGRVWTLPQFGPIAVAECERTIRVVEGRVLDWQI